MNPATPYLVAWALAVAIAFGLWKKSMDAAYTAFTVAVGCVVTSLGAIVLVLDSVQKSCQ